MKKNIRIFSLVVMIVAVATAFAGTGKYYGLWWNTVDSTEYFVSVNPYTSHKTVLDTIPGVKAILVSSQAYDTDNDRYIFVGDSAASATPKGLKGAVSYYYVIDAQTGAVVSQSRWSDNVNNIAYSPKDKTFYGLWWNTVDSTEYFVSVDPYTSTKTVLDSIPGVKWIVSGSSAFDIDSNRYVFVGDSAASATPKGTVGAVQYYYVIDAQTGAVVSQSRWSDNVNNIAYSPKDKTFYGLWWNAASSTEYFVSIDPYSSTKTVLESIPGVHWITMGGYAFDINCDRYVFDGTPAAGAASYGYVIDANSGGTISQAILTDNVNGLQYARSTTPEEDEAEASTEASDAGPTNVKLNPLKTSFSAESLPSGVIALNIQNGNGEGFSFAMHDMSGKTVVQVNDIRTNHVSIDGKGLERGIYFFQFKNSHALVGTGKLILR